MEVDPHALIDRIYEATLVPQLWQVAIEEMCELSNSVSGSVFFASLRHGPRGIASALSDDLFQQYSRTSDWADSPRATYALKQQPRSFVCINDFVPGKVLEADPIEQALNSLGAGFQVGATVALPSGDIAIFTFERALDQGRHSAVDLQQLELIRPHLSRAALLSSRLGLERISTMLGALGAIGMPAAALRADGRMVTASATFETSGVALPGAFGQIVINAPASHALFLQALEDTASAHALTVRSIPMPARLGATAKVLHLLPIRGAARDVFTHAAFLLVVTTFGATAAVPDLSLLHGLFDLTPKEAKLAAALASGQTLQEAAVASGIRYSTTRTHLEHIFQKTGTNRQIDLVLLLQGARPLQAPTED